MTVICGSPPGRPKRRTRFPGIAAESHAADACLHGADGRGRQSEGLEPGLVGSRVVVGRDWLPPDEERAQCCSQTPPLHADYTWTQDANGTPYPGATNTTLDAGTGNAATMRTEQTVDIHGNVVQSKVYNYAPGNSPGPLCGTTTNTYLTSSNYTSRSMYNRLWYATVANGSGQSAGVVTNTYDQYSYMPDTPGVRQHPYSAYNASTIYRGNITS